jgi:biopolymer transport protein ExbB/TolQ
MLRVALALLAVAVSAAAQSSSPPEKLQLTRRLVKAMDMENTMKSSLQAMMLSQRQAMMSIVRSSAGSSGFSGPDGEKAMDLMMSRLQEIMLPEMERALNIPAIIAEIVAPLYDRVFTDTELRFIVEFYAAAEPPRPRGRS